MTLSEGLRQMRRDLDRAEGDPAFERYRLTLMVFELEASNMEHRLFMLTGAEYVPLNGDFMHQTVLEAAP